MTTWECAVCNKLIIATEDFVEFDKTIYQKTTTTKVNYKVHLGCDT